MLVIKHCHAFVHTTGDAALVPIASHITVSSEGVSHIIGMSMQDLDVDDASLVTGMLAPARLSQLTQFVGLAAPPSKQPDEPSLTLSSLHGLSLDDKVATLSALQPSAAAAILGPQPTAARR